MSLKQEIIDILEKISDLLEFKEENIFKVNAFRNGANIVRNIEGDLENKIADGSIKNIKGIGKGLQSVIFDYYDNGKSTDLESLTKEVPDGIMDLLKIRGLGVKKVKIIYNQLGISDIEKLKEACLNNKISGLKGFGQKIQDSILKEIERIKTSEQFLLLNDAETYVDELLSDLKEIKTILKVEATGEYRRTLELISKIEFVILASDLKEFQKQLGKKYSNLKTLSITEIFPGSKIDEKKVLAVEVGTKISIPIYLYFTNDEKEFTHTLFISTGSRQFLDEFKFEKIANVKSEKEIFVKLGRDYIIPEMREKQFQSLSKKHKINSDLTLENFKGFFHFHTNYSDGRNTLSEMANALIKKDYDYLVVCDHSKSAFYANGLNEERIINQKKEINEVSKRLNIKIFHGIESDILKDGELDYSDDFMTNFDFVVASIHSRFQMPEDEMTKRIIKAVENPNTDVLGHPTGRLLLQREGYKLNINKVIDACAANKVAVEINAHPQRLDLDWRNIYYAREMGCLFSINPDAHSVEEIDLIKYGIMIARKGGILSGEVINCYDKLKFISFINRKINRKN